MEEESEQLPSCGLSAARARAVRSWLRQLCALLVPETTRASRAPIGNPSRESRASLRRWDDGDDESDEQAGHEPPSQRPLHCQLHRQWANGCLYQEGSVAFYEGRCLDDPY